MSVKPVNLARWAVNALDVDADNIVFPTSGQQDTGWTHGQKPPSGVLNFWMNRVHRWIKYLSDGAFSGPSSFDNTLVVGGALTVGGGPLSFSPKVFTADASSSIFVSAAHALQTGDGPLRVSTSGGLLPAGLSPTTDYWTIRNDLVTFRLATSFDSALKGVFQQISSNGTGTLTIASTPGTTRPADAAVTRNLVVSGSSAFADALITGALSTGAVTLSTNRNLTLSGTGDLIHGPREIVVGGTDFITIGSNSFALPTYTGSVWSFGGPPQDTIQGGVKLRTGDRILSITWHFAKGASPTTMAMKLLTRNGATNTDRDTLNDTTVGPAFLAVTHNAINYELAPGDATMLKVVAGGAANQFSHAVIAYDHPA